MQRNREDMGALATNRKRGEYLININGFSSPDRADLQVSKKPRFSPMHLTPGISSISSVEKPVSRIHQYPKPTQSFRREVHAPCRNPRFSSSSRNDMGNSILNRLQQAKNIAISSFWRKDKQVIVEDEDIEILNETPPHSRGLKQKQKVGLKEVEEFVNLEEDEEEIELKEKYKRFEEEKIRNQGSSSIVTDQTPKKVVDVDTGKLVEWDVDMGELPHKKLYDSAERRNAKLGHLNFQIGLITQKLSAFPKLVKKKPEEDALEEAFIPLTDEEEAQVSSAFFNSNRRKVVVKHVDSNIDITGQMLQCLQPGAWLNDEVINVYLELLKEREKRDPKKFLKCHFFNTFFYKKLISGNGGYNYKAVSRWTSQRKLGYGLIDCDKIFVPIHKEIHWCLAVINKKDQKFQYLDSLKGRDTKVLKVLARYFVDEVKDKSAKDLDVSSWKEEFVTDLPAQKNGFDCGVFMIKYADFYSRGFGLSFKQDDMPYFRRRTAKEILKLKAE